MIKIDQDKTILSSMPCDDHAIFVDKDGFVHERMGVAWVGTTYDDAEVFFVSDSGNLNLPHEGGKEFSIIAHRGETIPFSRLFKFYPLLDSTSNLIECLNQYGVTIDRKAMKPTLYVYFLVHDTDDAAHCIMKIDDKKSLATRTREMEINVSFYLMTNTGEDSQICYYLLPIFTDYCALLDAPVNVEVYFQKYVGLAEEGEERNRLTYENERIFLPSLRESIKKTVNKAWESCVNRSSEEKNKQNFFEEKMDELGSDYDKNPELT